MKKRAKNIVLGVTGSIAAYKAADLVRRLREQEYEVKVIMTRGAEAFITPLTMQAVSGHTVGLQLLDAQSEAAMDHINLARWADLILVAPASANFIARLANGLADDLLTTVCLASRAPVYVAPAMNHVMYSHGATQDNIATLSDRNVTILGPASGDQACGETGPGRMLEPHEIIAQLQGRNVTATLQGKHVLITAGPTREEIDPVRYISNYSSGRMGYSLAHACLQAGAEVTLVSGPVSLRADPAINKLPVTSASEMFDAVMSNIKGQDIFIASAAVADYRPQQFQSEKIKKGVSGDLVLKMVSNPDILASVCALPQRPYCVGFAAETSDLENYARNKLESKGADMIVGNLVGQATGGFNRAENEVNCYWPGGNLFLPLASKQQIARELVSIISEHYKNRQPGVRST